MSRFTGLSRITVFSTYPKAFVLARAVVGAAEGGFQKRESDKGNWTGGKVGVGKLVGTKFGISAASYPALDIPNITPEEATEIFYWDFWCEAGCDTMVEHGSAALAVCAFDAAVLNGVGNAARWLQTMFGVPADGDVGPRTRTAMEQVLATSMGQARCDSYLVANLMERRLNFMRSLSTWGEYGGGWGTRLVRLPALAYGVAREAGA